MKRIHASTFSFLFTLLMWLMSSAYDASAQKRPNIVFFLVDDLGWGDIAGYSGSTFYETPNIDRLAQNGVRFMQAYSASTLCSPTRASILTGKSPGRLHITHAIPILGYLRIEDGKGTRLKDADYRMNLPFEEVTIAEALKSAGYATASIGKWHVGYDEAYYPQAHGFDINVGGNGNGATGNYFHPYDNKWRMSRNHPYKEWKTLPDGKPGEYITDRLTDESLRFIEDNVAKGKPFFLYLSHYAVHTPIQAPAELVDKYKAKPVDSLRGHNNPGYAAMIETVDRSMGALVEKLKALGVYENTIVIFTSDNGGMGKVTRNHPFRGNKGNFYEGGIRVPLIVNWPNVTRTAVNDVPVISADLYPTMLQMASLPLNPGQHMDGLSLVRLLKGGSAPKRKDLYWHFPNYTGDNQHPNPSLPLSVIRSGDYKLIESLEDGSLELYDLKSDPAEKSNIASSKPEVAARMQKKLAAWRTASQVQMPEVNPNYEPKK
jgi:arylsulfatase A